MLKRFTFSNDHVIRNAYLIKFLLIVFFVISKTKLTLYSCFKIVIHKNKQDYQVSFYSNKNTYVTRKYATLMTFKKKKTSVVLLYIFTYQYQCMPISIFWSSQMPHYYANFDFCYRNIKFWCSFYKWGWLVKYVPNSELS